MESLCSSSSWKVKLAGIAQNKRRVVCVIKYYFPFFTKLEDLHQPDDTLLIAIMDRRLEAPHPTSWWEEKFDLVLWYSADYSLSDSVRAVNGDTATLYNVYYDVDWPFEDATVLKYVKEIVESLGNDKDKLRLVATEELIIGLTCKLREEHAIVGPRHCDIDPWRNKLQAKSVVLAHGIATTKWFVLDGAQIHSSEPITHVVGAVETRFDGHYPLHVKPIKGCGSGGARKLESRSALEAWWKAQRGAEDALQAAKSTSYLVEEFIQGREFWATVCLPAGGTWRPLLLRRHAHNVVESLQSGKTIQCYAGSFERFEAEFPGMGEWVGRVIKALKPPHPGIFCVQGFQLHPATSEYLYTECAYRPNGRRGSPSSYAATGISLETALISCHLDDTYVPRVDPDWDPNTCAGDIWWPYREGVLVGRKELNRERLPEWFTSAYEIKWYVEAGKRLQVAETLGQFIASTVLVNKSGDYKKLKRDMDWLAENWEPEISDS